MNAAIVVPVDEDVLMVIDDLDDEIMQIEHKVEKAWELAKAQVEKLKADKAECEHKRLEDEQRCKDELRKAESQKAEEDPLAKEEAAVKMHANKAKEQWDVSSVSYLPVHCKLTLTGGGRSGDSQEESE